VLSGLLFCQKAVLMAASVKVPIAHNILMVDDKLQGGGHFERSRDTG
jgi:hypothetical protein